MINSNADFNKLLSVLNTIEINGVSMQSEHITYAVLELLNNSMRAHRENNIDKKIRTEFTLSDRTLSIFIQDWGGGFDPSVLPYDLNGDPNDIDMHGQEFQQYREEHGYKRFGIGMLIVKKTFDHFKIYFIDEEMNPVTWDSGKVSGTCIELGLGENKNG
jgi:anti-sigma regulatory factor (Ser/Thr protein kinase)